MPMEINNGAVGGLFDEFLTERLMRKARFLNNNWQLLWRAATPLQKKELNPILAGWVNFYNEKFYKAFYISNDDLARFEMWKKKFSEYRKKFKDEGTDVDPVPDYGPGAEDPPEIFADFFKDFISAVKWVSVPIVGYYIYRIFFATRADIKAMAKERRARKILASK